MDSKPLVLVRGGGDLATGVAARLHRCGFLVLVAEIPQPLAVRRLVSLAEAVYEGQVQIEDLCGRLVQLHSQIVDLHQQNVIPVMVDPTAEVMLHVSPVAVVDARMRKKPPEPLPAEIDFLIGLGPGFTAGLDCQAVVETNRGHHLGRVLWEGTAEPDTGVPEPVDGIDAQRVLRAPGSGRMTAKARLGSVVCKGDLLAEVDDTPLIAPFAGALRGLIHDGIEVHRGMKVGDLDPRRDPSLCFQMSDKALAVGGGVLEALLVNPRIRRRLGGDDAAL